MAIVEVGYHPDLTTERAMEVFRAHFAPQYQVQKSNLLSRDFVVQKSGWTGVGVKLEQKAGSTSFVFTAFLPSFMLQMLVGNLIAMLILRPSWKGMEQEVRTFIENAKEFK